jgi:hypothetical protein
MLDVIKKTRNGKFRNYREGQLGAERLRHAAKTKKMFDTPGDEQKANGQSCDILLVAAQFGLPSSGSLNSSRSRGLPMATSSVSAPLPSSAS